MLELKGILLWVGTWTIEEVDFNIVGLSMDCFLPPSDGEREHEGAEQAVGM